VSQLIADCDQTKKITSAALVAGMELFETGDKRLLCWAESQDFCGTLKIVSPRQAWTALM
jgi:hypothetical protein